MTADEWRRCADPEAMLDLVRPTGDERRFRLFACACCREATVWHYLTHPRSRSAVETAERFADNWADLKEMADARAAAPIARTEGGPWNAWCKVHISSQGQADRAVLAATTASAWDAATGTARWLTNLVHWSRQCDLVRDIFRCPTIANDLRHASVTDDVLTRAKSIYDEQAFDRMLDLADRLERTGYADATVVAHCRSARPHALGCWALDRLLGNVREVRGAGTGG